MRTTIKEIQKTRQKIVDSVKKIPKQFTDSISRGEIDELLAERHSMEPQSQTGQQGVIMCYFRSAPSDLADDTNKNINKHKRPVPHFESINIAAAQNEDIKGNTEKSTSLIEQDKGN